MGAVPYVLQYNLNIQREIMRDTVLTVGYIGSHGVHLITPLEQNPPKLIGGVAGTFNGVGSVTPNPRLNPNILQYATMGPYALSRYNSLQSTLNHRFSHNVQVQVAYTYSKCMSDGGYLGSFNSNVSSVVSNPYNQKEDWGPCAWDIKHVLNVNGLYALPFHGNRIVEGWQVSGIARATSGLPFSVGTGVDTSGFGNTTLRPDSLTGNVNPISGTTASGETLGTPARWFDPTQFGPPAIGTVGNLGAARCAARI